MSNLSFNNLLLEQPENGVYRLVISRPKVLNALNTATLQEMNSAIDQIKANEKARVLLVTGAGDKAFVAGADIAEMQKLSALQGKAFAEQGQALLRKLETLPIPVIALVNGFALGGGCELAMACDFILAANNARFGQPEVNLDRKSTRLNSSH